MALTHFAPARGTAAGFLFYIADPTDPTGRTIWIDFNGANVFGRGFGVIDFPDGVDFGTLDPELDLISQTPHPGSILAARRHPVTQMAFNMYAVADEGELEGMVEELATALDTQGVIVWQPGPAAPVKFIDYLPSAIPDLRHGQTRALFKTLALEMDPDGLPMRINRQPYGRLPEMQAADQLSHNGSLLEASLRPGLPDQWGIVDGVVGTIQASESCWEAVMPSAASGKYILDPSGNFVIGLQSVDLSDFDPNTWFTFASDMRCVTADLIMPVLGFTVANVLTLQFGSTYGIQNASTEWARPALSLQAPNGATAASFGFAGRRAGAAVRLRRAQFEAATEPTTFRAGPEIVSQTPFDVSSGTGRKSFGKRLYLYNPSNLPARARIELAPADSSAQWVGATLATRQGPSNILDLSALFAFPIRSTTPGMTLYSYGVNDTGVTNEAAAAGSTDGLAAKTTFAAGGPLIRRWRKVITPPDNTVFRGSFEVWAIVKPIHSNLDPDSGGQVFTIQARYDLANVSDAFPAERTLETVTLDMGNVDLANLDTEVYVPVLLGTVRMSDGTDLLVLEGWAAREDSSGGNNANPLYWDYVWLRPAEQTLSLLLPGFRSPIGGTEVFAPDDLIPGSAITSPPYTEAPTLGDPASQTPSFVALRTGRTAVEVPPAVGTELGTGEHVYTFTMNVRNQASVGAAGKALGVIEVVESDPVPPPPFVGALAAALGDADLGTIQNSVFAGTNWPAPPFVAGVQWDTDNTATYNERILVISRISQTATTTTFQIQRSYQGTLTFHHNNGRKVIVQHGNLVVSSYVKAPRSGWVTRVIEARFPALAGKLYVAVARYRAQAVDGQQIHIRKVVHSFAPFLDAARLMVSDGQQRRTTTELVSGGRAGQLFQEGGYIEIPPGTSELFVDIFSRPPPGYDAVDARWPLPKNSPATAAKVTVDIIPLVMPI